MALPTASDNQFPKVILEEVANDGSATVTPAADHRALFLGEDGGLHLKDSAAAVTDIVGASAHIADTTDAHDASAVSFDPTGLSNTAATELQTAMEDFDAAIDSAGGGGLASGTAFPGGPADNDLFYRTDRDLLYFYNGSAWLTVTLYETQFVWSVAGVSSDAAQAYYPVDSTYGMFLVEMVTSWHVGGTNNGSNFWEIELRRVDSAAAETEIGNVSTSAGSGSTWTRQTLSIGAALDSSARVLLVRADETGAAGNLSFACALRFRLIG